MIIFDMFSMFFIIIMVGIIFLYFRIIEKGAWNLFLLILLILGCTFSIAYNKTGYFSFTEFQSILIISIGLAIISLHSGVGLNFSFNDDFIEKVLRVGFSLFMMFLIVFVPVFYFVFNFDIITSFILSILLLPTLYIKRDRKDIEHIMKDLSLVIIGLVLVVTGVLISFSSFDNPYEISLSLAKTIIFSLALSFVAIIIVSNIRKKTKNSFMILVLSSIVMVFLSIWFKANIILTSVIFAILFGALYIKNRTKMLNRLDNLIKYLMYVGVFITPFFIDLVDFNRKFILVGFMVFLLVILIKFIVIVISFEKYKVKEILIITLNHNLTASLLLMAFLVLNEVLILSNEIRGIILCTVLFSLISSFASNRLMDVLDKDF